MLTIREEAVRYTCEVLRRASDWQDGLVALGDHPRFGPWLETQGDAVVVATSIIREAEDRLGDALPY